MSAKIKMNIIDLIERKRDGGELTTDQIEWFVSSYTAGDIPDYQAAALMMAIFIRGMKRRETVDLTLAMARSGDQLDLHDVAPFVVDKHSSGGVGDKTTLVVQPLVAACGVPVGKVSGRGLGASGGTLDKMESFRGWSATMGIDRFKRQLAEIGLALVGQSANLAPADGKLYALRDVTGTIGNVSLIAASIMSKKLAAGADAVVLDVKTGSGAFMKTVPSARELARVMVDIGKDAGRKTVALISDMNQPLGHAVGNALEAKEAIATLHGGGPQDFWSHCQEIAAHMLLLAGKAPTLEDARTLASAARNEGRAWNKFRDLLQAQGGDVSQADDPSLLPLATLIEPIPAPRSGAIAAIDAGAIGWASVRLGAGRLVKGQPIDHAVGLILPHKVGDRISAGETLAHVHANDPDRLKEACEAVLAAITWADGEVNPLPLFHGTIS